MLLRYRVIRVDSCGSGTYGMNEVHVYREQVWKSEPSFVFVLESCRKGFPTYTTTDDHSNNYGVFCRFGPIKYDSS